MSLKSSNLQRSAEGSPDGKAAVLEERPTGVATVARTRAEKKVRPRVITQTPPAPPASAADDVEAMYIEHRSLLLYVAARKFRIPECDSENLIHEVFISFLQTGTKINDVRAWLVAAMCNASRHYWRAQGRTESLPEDFGDQQDPGTQGLADKFATQMTVHQALQYLPQKCRETLWLHYFEGRSAGDVARELETTSRYAEKLIHNCLKRVREIYLNITSVTR